MTIVKRKPLRPRKRRSRSNGVEQCWILVGHCRGRIWLARRIGYAAGGPARVEFDGPWALRREERQHDVIGFLHTHPHGGLRPSLRDLRTMRLVQRFRQTPAVRDRRP